MIFEGKCFRSQYKEPGIAEVVFDVQGDSANKMSMATLTELKGLLDALDKEKDLKGVVFLSAKEAFCVGADVNEFIPLFRGGVDNLTAHLNNTLASFNRLEDLPYPTVMAIHGHCVGGGMEFAMSATYRVAATGSVFAQPEVKLGFLPGFGGTVRLPRLVGADHAIELLASGRNMDEAEALKKHLVQAVVDKDKLWQAAVALIRQAETSADWKTLVAQKKAPLKLNPTERMMAFVTARAAVADQAGPHYPAPVKIVEVLEKAAGDSREAALKKETQAALELAKNEVTPHLIRILLGDLALKKMARQQSEGAGSVKRAAVLGAGIMGGGIAYQSAYKGTPIVMRDIAPQALEKGYEEITRLLAGQMGRGKLSMEKMGHILTSVQGTLTLGELATVDLVVEAVVENLDIKKKVLAEVEAVAGPKTVIATNTSTLRVDDLAQALKDPSRFCGMHFFNPVYRMPLVEIVRGKATSPETLATAVAYAQSLGKTPIVVADGTGFLVNRVLFPYMNAFQYLVVEGAPIEMIDKTMEKWGWPMGPALLCDVVGLDTVAHIGTVLGKAFPEWFKDAPSPLPSEVLYKAGYLGQKNSKGFYGYAPDKKGKPKKHWDAAVLDVLKPAVKGGSEGIYPEEVVDRMMIPMVIEAARCLENKIVGSAMELDMALIYGLGYPPFRGGLLRWADQVGVAALVEKTQRYQKLGHAYQPTESMQQMAKAKTGFYQE